MKVPQCLNNDFFESVVRNGINLKDFKIVDSKVEIATSPGDNYCSSIYRVFLDITDGQNDRQKIIFLVKHLLNSESGSSIVEFMDMLDKEIDMIRNILPRLTKIANGVSFSPRFYHSLSEPQAKIIAMQDLGELQYRMTERKEALDFDHCCIALKKLGQMHASSMVLAQEHPSLMDNYSFGLFHGSLSNPGLLHSCMHASFPTLCQVSKEWKGFEAISQKLNNMKDQFWDMVSDSVSREYDGYRVLNHGDFWINNFLFKYNEKSGKPIDVLCVDFQASYYTTPANDLQYFLNTSPKIHIREDHREDLLRIYYASFEETLKESNFVNIPTFAQLLEEMRKREMFGFMSAVFILPLVLMEEQSEQGCGLDGLADPEVVQEMTNIMFTGKRFTKVMKYILLRCDELKLFDGNFLQK